MLVPWLIVLLLFGSEGQINERLRLVNQSIIERATYRSQHLTPLDDLENVAHFGDAEHRGPTWYDVSSDLDISSRSDLDSKITEDDSSIPSRSKSAISSGSNEASSVETEDLAKANKFHRTCTPCFHDLLKKHTNLGIKWICAGYQRARRTFKSECMMRYRNCQDGTMFTKIHEHRCKNDSYHGRHWFYVYRV